MIISGILQFPENIFVSPCIAINDSIMKFTILHSTLNPPF